jgi:hypothetical protein
VWIEVKDLYFCLAIRLSAGVLGKELTGCVLQTSEDFFDSSENI